MSNSERDLLRRIVKYVDEDKATTRGTTRLARAVNEARSLLATPAPPPVPAPDVEGLRPEVLAFACLMAAKLRENDHKGGWQYTPTNYLAARLGEEAAELNALLIEARTDIASPPSSALNREERIKVGREAADVANFAMMIADVCGSLAAHRAGAPRGTDGGKDSGTATEEP